MNTHIVQLLVIVQESTNHLATQQTQNDTTKPKIFSQGLVENQLQIKFICFSIKYVVNS